MMLNDICNAFPAGDESEESCDEWDIGYCNDTQKASAEVCEPRVNGLDKISTLKRAITAGNVDLVRELLDGGLDVETKLGFDWTPLMCAVHVANQELAELLLDRGACANFSRDHYTVLMAACTAASASEEKISKCVALLLSRNADPNVCNKNSMTCLMLAARYGYCQVLNLLVSHGAELNFQNDVGQTALIMAVQYGQEGAVLKLLQLGADKYKKNKTGKTAAELASVFKYAQILRYLEASDLSSLNGTSMSRAEVLTQFLNGNVNGTSASKESSCKLTDIELLLHGLDLDYLSSIIMEHDVTWSDLLIMDRSDLEKIGVTDPEDQKKIRCAMEQMQLDKVDLDSLTPLNNIDRASEDFLSFLISLKQECCYLTEALQDIVSRFPRSSTEVVLTCNPTKEAQALCSEIFIQTGDLQKEILCLKTLLSKTDGRENVFLPLQLNPTGGSQKKVHVRFAVMLGLGIVGAGLLFVLSQGKK
ncbi:hypothetical protein DNTS_003367 [Danionella cerebrum]|uniref:Ankyrin repeat, SAM and basic leucine zipper domain-containing protein 1 n=1 Tax=Danionella cerebrum TaxID=2873325 RepID=A0A553NLT6_9TELE|nr:hypothetical protein DNTS_003367 [Danionella translucida]